MIIYNVTVSIDDSIEKEWLKWMREKHIPEVMATGIFIKAQISRVITSEDSGHTFAIAYTCFSMKELHQYQIKFSTILQKKHREIFGGKAVVFRTLMEILDEF